MSDVSSALSSPPPTDSIDAFNTQTLAMLDDSQRITVSTKTTTRRRKAVVYKEEEEEEEAEEEEDEVIVSTTKTKVRKRKQAPVDSDFEGAADEEKTVVAAATISKKRKTTSTSTKKQPKLPAMAAAAVARTLASKMLIGAHVSMAKGVQNSITNAAQIGANSLALFLKNQRRWTSSPLSASDTAAFRRLCTEHAYNPRTQILPHGSYLINLATPSAEKQTQAYDCFVDDLRRCESLGIGLYNFHPGSTLGEPRAEALARISAALNRAHKVTSFVKTVVENMVGSGNVVGSSFEDLRDIIAGVEEKSRVGVCLDTCHLFAAGHDIRTEASYAQVMQDFDEIVGREYLCAIHLNDSKGPLASKKDLHQNIGLGYLGLEAFRVIMNDASLEGLPMILETPTGEDPGVWAGEIKLLEGLVGLKGGEERFLKMAEELQEKGREERDRVSGVVERVKKAKEAKGKKTPGKGGKKTPGKRGKKKVETESEDEGEESEGGCSH